jgi:hypothetical protein
MDPAELIGTVSGLPTPGPSPVFEAFRDGGSKAAYLALGPSCRADEYADRRFSGAGPDVFLWPDEPKAP